MNKSYVRARKPEEKEQRKLHLLNVARSLIENKNDLNVLSLNEIARSANMAKANVYRYFESREALLLELLWDEWQAWYKEFQKDWSKLSSNKKNIDNLAKVMASSFSNHGLLCNLTTALPAVLEKNLSFETIKEFKYRSLIFFGDVAHYLESCSADLSAKKYALFLQDTVTLIAGLYPFTQTNTVVDKVLSDPQLKFFKRDFKSELERYICALLNVQKQKTKRKIQS